MKKEFNAVALLLAISGAAAPFLPFTYDYSPLDTVLPGGRHFALLGAPFFLAIPIVIWQARRLIGARISRFESAAAYALSAGAMLSVLWFIVSFLMSQGLETLRQADSAVTIGVCLALAGANTLLLARNLASACNQKSATEIFLLGGYLPNAAFCLIGFGWNSITNLQIGALVVLIACIGYLCSIILASPAEQRPPEQRFQRADFGLDSVGEAQ